MSSVCPNTVIVFGVGIVYMSWKEPVGKHDNMMKAAKKIGRRRFLRRLLNLLAGAPAYAALGPVSPARGETRRYAKLVDSIKCIG